VKIECRVKSELLGTKGLENIKIKSVNGVICLIDAYRLLRTRIILMKRNQDMFAFTYVNTRLRHLNIFILLKILYIKIIE